MDEVKRYYRKKESRWGYKLILGGVRHFGYYPKDSGLSHSEAMIRMMDEVGHRLNLPKNSKILDAGCGEGKTAIRLAKKFGYKITGVDLLAESIEQAKKQSKGSNGLNFITGNFEKPPFDDNQFDGIYALETFTHAHSHKKAIQEFNRVLKPGGRLVIFDYETTPIDQIKDTKVRKSVLAVSKGTAAAGVINFNHGFFKSFLDKYNYEKIEVEDLTDRIKPMLRYFHRLARPVHFIIKFLNLEVRFPNITAGAIGLRACKNGWYKFVAVSATRPKR